MSWKFIVFLLFCLGSTHSSAFNLAEKKYTIYDGLGSNTINDIVQDDDGFLWIANSKGITRFDGYNFINYNSSNITGFFRSDEVLKLVKRGAYIYLLSIKEGLIQLNPKTARFKQIFNSPIATVAFQGDLGAYYFENGQLLLSKKNTVIRRAHFDNPFRSTLTFYNNKLMLSRPNSYYDALIEIDLRSLKKTHSYQLNSTHIESACVKSLDGKRLYFNTGEKIYRIDSNKQLIEDPVNKEILKASYFAEDINAQPLGVIDRRTAFFKGLNGRFLRYIDKKNNTELRSVIKINDQTIFIASNQGLIKLTMSTKQNGFIDDNQLYDDGPIRVRRKIIEGPDGTIYFLGFPGMNMFHQNRIKQLTFGPSPLFDAAWHKGKLYATTEGDGFFYYDFKRGKFIRIMNKSLLVNDFSTAIEEINDTTLMLGRRGSVVLFNPSSGYIKTIQINTKKSVYSIVKGIHANEYYLGTNTSVERIEISRNWEIVRKATYATNQLKVRDILINNANELWVATEGGIHILHPKHLKKIRYIYKSNEISNENVASLLKDNQGRIWASTFGGITIFDSGRKFPMFLKTSNNLKNQEYNFKSGTKLSNGKLIFGGLNMYDIIDPTTIGNIKFKSAFLITNVEKTKDIFNRQRISFANINQEQIYFNTGTEDLTIQLSNFDYTHGNDYNFDYRISKSGWTRISTQNSIHISNLPYGTHELDVRMINPYGEIVQTKTILLHAVVPFYERKSFIIAISLLAISLSILSAFYYRQFHLIEKMTKTRIAMDLHDEAGTILTRLLLISNSLKDEIPQKVSLDKGIKEVLTSIRAFIESMSRPQNTIQDLYIDIEDFLSITLRNTPINYQLTKDESSKHRISGEMYRDIKLCVFEGVNNCIKHADCQHIEVSILLKNKSLHIVIVDDGNLTDISDLKSAGNGIRNIRKRANRNFGVLLLSINPVGHGLQLELKF
jgi:hypothetical protein